MIRKTIVEPKALYANERTFLHYTKVGWRISMVFSISIYNSMRK